MSISDPFISKDAAKLGGTPGIASKRIKGISENERNVWRMSEEGDQDLQTEKDVTWELQDGDLQTWERHTSEDSYVYLFQFQR